MSKYDEEVNKILFEVNFMDGLKTFASGAAGLAKNLAPVANVAGKVIKGAANAAAGLAGADVTVNPNVKEFVSKISQSMKNLLDKMQGVSYGIVIDDNLIKTLHGVYGPTVDNTIHSSKVNLGNNNAIVIALVNNYKGYTLRKMGENILSTMQQIIKIDNSTINTPSSAQSTMQVSMSGNELIKEKDLLSFGASNKQEMARYQAEIKGYNIEYQKWISGGKQTAEPTIPKDPSDSSVTNFNRTIKSYLELHIGKVTYKQALEHLLQYLTLIYKNIAQRGAANLQNLVGSNTKAAGSS